MPDLRKTSSSGMLPAKVKLELSLNVTCLNIPAKTLTKTSKFKKKCVCETLMPPKHPSFEKLDPDI